MGTATREDWDHAVRQSEEKARPAENRLEYTINQLRTEFNYRLEKLERQIEVMHDAQKRRWEDEDRRRFDWMLALLIGVNIILFIQVMLAPWS